MSKTSPKGKEKKILRKEILSIRKNMTSVLVDKYSDIICEKLIKTDIYNQSKNICIYMPIQNEVDLTHIIKDAWSKNKRVYLPRIINAPGDVLYSKEDKRMDFFLYTKDTSFITGAYNILEPENDEMLLSTADALIVMPGAVFSRDRKRIGYGGGYYDRYLASHPECHTIAVAYSFQVLDDIPCNDYDIKPQLIITEAYEI